MDHLEEIRAKISIEELVSGYVQLKKAGRNLKGLCPFHNDSHPSLMVSPEKGIAYCFACNNGGDIFKFIQLIENVEFPEAVRILADRAGVPLPTFKKKTHNQRLKIIEINQSAAKFFEEQLEACPKMKNYFLKRGLSEETIHHFRLGFAPGSYHALKDQLIKIGYTEKELMDAGLLNQRSIADKSTYDRFRNRLIFPILDHQDNTVGFGGRIVAEGEPKYLNSPETPAYNKSLVLYGLNWGKKAVKETDLAIFVEGYMDVIACHQAGFENVIATSGTALTTPQLKLIKRYTKNVAFAFDQDSAGMEATLRAIELTRQTDLNLKIITLPEGQDPDDCIKESPENWEKAVKEAMPVMDFYFAYANKKFDKNTMEGKKQFMELLLPLIKQYSTEMEQSNYLERLAVELKTDVKHLWNDLRNLTVKKTVVSSASQEEKSPPKPYVFSREEYLLGFIFQYPEFYALVEENLIDSIPCDPKTEKFYKIIRKAYNQSSAIDFESMKAEMEPEERERMDIYRLLIEEHYPDFSGEAVQREIKEYIRLINRKNIENAEKELIFKMKEVGDRDESRLLLNQKIQISKLKNRIESSL